MGHGSFLNGMSLEITHTVPLKNKDKQNDVLKFGLSC